MIVFFVSLGGVLGYSTPKNKGGKMIKTMKKIKDCFMIISITEVKDGIYQIVYARQNPFNLDTYHGLIINSFKTSDSVLFKKFNRFGVWLKRKDKDIDVLLYLLKTEWKISSQIDFI